MASNVRQSVFGGLFGLSLYFVILPLFMRFRSSGGNDANDVAPHGVGDEKHAAVDQADHIEPQLTSGIAIIELDDVRVQKHLRRRLEVDAMLLSIGEFLGPIPFEVHRMAQDTNILKFSTDDKFASLANHRSRASEVTTKRAARRPPLIVVRLPVAYSAAMRTSGAAARTSASTCFSYLTKFSWNMRTSLRAVSSNAALSFQVFIG